MSEIYDALLRVNPLETRILSILVFIAVILFLYFLEKRLRTRKYEYTEQLFFLSRRQNCSEYDIFHKAAEKWGIPEDRIKTDFREYLFYDEIPFYVRDYLRSNF